MSSGKGGIKKKQYTKTKHENEQNQDQVDNLLRATEDDILLKLTVDSHMSRGSSSHIIHPDLDRRFKALRSSSSSSNSKPPSSTAKPTVNTSNNKLNKAPVVNDDDLFARFAALKSTLPSYSNKNQLVENDDEGDEGDEVDEVIRWAIDAAALDPSPPSDDDDDDVSDDSSNEQSDDEDKDEDDIEKKEKKKGEQK